MFVICFVLSFVGNVYDVHYKDYISDYIAQYLGENSVVVTDVHEGRVKRVYNRVVDSIG